MDRILLKTFGSTHAIVKDRRVAPDPGDIGPAKPAPAFFNVIGGDKIAVAFDQHFLTVVAVRVIALVARNIPHIDIPDPLAHGRFSEFRQNGNRRGGETVELVFGKKPQEMKGMIRSEGMQNPVAHAFDHLLVVGVPGDHQVGHFKMDFFFMKGLKRIQDRGQMGPVKLQINFLAEGFEIHIGRIQNVA